MNWDRIIRRLFYSRKFQPTSFPYWCVGHAGRNQYENNPDLHRGYWLLVHRMVIAQLLV